MAQECCVSVSTFATQSLLRPPERECNTSHLTSQTLALRSWDAAPVCERQSCPHPASRFHPATSAQPVTCVSNQSASARRREPNRRCRHHPTTDTDQSGLCPLAQGAARSTGRVGQ